MNKAQRLLHAADRLQQGHAWLAVPVAVGKKFGDDQAGNLAALVAYYGFVAIFPLLLVFVTVLDLVLKNNATLKQHLLNSALGQFPVIGTQLKSNVHSLNETGVALAIGLIGTLLGARGVAGAIQNALDTAWAIPFARRPGFPWSLLRSLGLMAVVGPGQVVTVLLSTVAAGAGHVISGTAAHIGAIAVSLLLNVGLFWLSFRLGTAREVAGRALWLGAILAAIAWQVLQIAGGYLVAHQLARNSALYGVFAIVLGLIAWLYLIAELTMYAVELNVVRTLRLWPRSMAPPPLTSADVRAYRLYAQTEQRRTDYEVDIQRSADQPAAPWPTGRHAAAAASGGQPPAGQPSASSEQAAAEQAAADQAAADQAAADQAAADQAAADQAAAEQAAGEASPGQPGGR
jgi:YihY family inner membrane protein